MAQNGQPVDSVHYLVGDGRRWVAQNGQHVDSVHDLVGAGRRRVVLLGPEGEHTDRDI